MDNYTIENDLVFIHALGVSGRGTSQAVATILGLSRQAIHARMKKEGAAFLKEAERVAILDHHSKEKDSLPQLMRKALLDYARVNEGRQGLGSAGGLPDTFNGASCLYVDEFFKLRVNAVERGMLNHFIVSASKGGYPAHYLADAAEIPPLQDHVLKVLDRDTLPHNFIFIERASRVPLFYVFLKSVQPGASSGVEVWMPTQNNVVQLGDYRGANIAFEVLPANTQRILGLV